MVAAALRTPPCNLVLSEVDDEPALDLLVADLGADKRGFNLPGVVGPPDVAAGFREPMGGDPWRPVGDRDGGAGLPAHHGDSAPAGERRHAGGDLRGPRRCWSSGSQAFGREALGDDDASRAESSVDDWLAGKGRHLWLWDDDGPKSLTGVGGETPNGIRIGPVYTPPGDRGQGYASALVAAVSQAQLDAGRRFCFLYADLANPTSNRIYQAIGYRPVTDALRIDFV